MARAGAGRIRRRHVCPDQLGRPFAGTGRRPETIPRNPESAGSGKGLTDLPTVSVRDRSVPAASAYEPGGRTGGKGGRQPRRMPQPKFRPIDQMAAEWDSVSRTPESRQAVRRLADVEPVVASLHVADLGSLVQVLRDGRGDRRVRSAHVIQAMLRSQSVDPLLPRAILQAVVPGLVTVARRLSWGDGGDWDDGGAFFADLVATAWEVIVAWSGEDRAYAVLDLLSAVRCRLRRQMLQQRDQHQRTELGLEADDALLGLVGHDTSDLELLAAAIDDLAGHGLDEIDAAVLYGNRVLGLSISELSQLTGRTRRNLSERRQRAERQLCA
jgi:hypothetical protein